MHYPHGEEELPEGAEDLRPYFQKMSVPLFLLILFLNYGILTAGIIMAEFWGAGDNAIYVLQVLFYVVMFIGFFLLPLHREDRKAILYEDPQERKPLVMIFLPFFIMGLFTVLYTLLLQAVAPRLYESFINAPNLLEGLDFGTNPWAFVLTFLAVVILAPVVEEIVFRGILFNLLNRKRGMATAMVVSSILFGVLHLETMVPTAIIGFTLCFIYQKTGSLKLVMGAHMFNNLMAFSLPFLIGDLNTQDAAYLTLSLVLFLLYVASSLYFVYYVLKNRSAFQRRSPIYRAWRDDFDL